MNMKRKNLKAKISDLLIKCLINNNYKETKSSSEEIKNNLLEKEVSNFGFISKQNKYNK